MSVLAFGMVMSFTEPSVNSPALAANYSTVTDFARFLGLSTSVPRITAA